ncbi:hypothetical protein RIF29_17835 [Crotalaria pallida]|uniref:Uncharacterized protein n=1 Tax=Crotalaria pallida TaxID=3830 RepID=A0AAN9FL70_CROPI
MYLASNSYRICFGMLLVQRQPKLGRVSDGSHYLTDSSFDFPPLPVTNLSDKSGQDENSGIEHGDKHSAQHKLRFEDDRMHSFQINNNVDLVIESNGQHPFAEFVVCVQIGSD